MTFRTVFAAIALFATAIALPKSASAEGVSKQDAQDLVDRARMSVDAVLSEKNFGSARELMKTAKGVLIIPQFFKAGFFVGGAGGNGVLLARTPEGQWSQPAFYTMGAGSIGLQFGIQDSQVILIIRTEKGLISVLDDQVKLGADASIAVGTLGAGMGGATTTNVGADIVTYSLARGGFAGGAFEGAVIGKRSDYNKAYYGQDVEPRAILQPTMAPNPGSAALRDALTKY